MLEYTTYICEYCGEVFTNEEECMHHENEEREKLFNRTIKLFDFNKKEISITEAIKNPESIYAIYFSSEEMHDFLTDIFGLYATEPGFYIWLDLGNSWVNVDFLLNEMQEYKRVLEEAQKKED